MGKNILKPISCSKCGANMQWQITELDCLVNCKKCKRAVVVSDWQSNAKFFSK